VTTVCGTGHRPDKLGGYGYDVHKNLIAVADQWLRENAPDRVISGGALGWDQALAHAARRLGIPYIMALPFNGFESRWPQTSVQYLSSLCDGATRVVYVCDPGYAPWKMQKRNEWMVQNARQVLALWNGTDGGTANCVRYAESVGKPVINLWNKYKPYMEYDPRDFLNVEEDFDGMDIP